MAHVKNTHSRPVRKQTNAGPKSKKGYKINKCKTKETREKLVCHSCRPMSSKVCRTCSKRENSQHWSYSQYCWNSFSDSSQHFWKTINPFSPNVPSGVRGFVFLMAYIKTSPLLSMQVNWVVRDWLKR